MTFAKTALAAVISASLLAMTGCGSDDNDNNNTVVAADYDANRAQGVVASSLLKTSIDVMDDESYEVVFPANAIFLDAEDLADSAADAFSKIKDGDVIVFPKGYFKLPNQIKVTGDVFDIAGDGRLDNITIMGHGHNETVLDFSAVEKGSKGENVGVDGLLISDVNNLTISDMTVVEAGKNAVKVENIKGFHMHHAATIWDGELTEENGAYGIYPVNSENILIENTFTRGSADAGVYVGQSTHVIVRNSVALENVAGMEIENCSDAEFYGNRAEKNTAGLLVFDLPIGNGKYGENVRVYNNVMIDNNTPNFAKVSDFAGGVHIAPHGTGMIILSTSDVEIFDNTITNHKTSAVAVADYAFAEDPGNLIVMPQGLVDAGLATQTNYLSVYEDGYSPTVRNITIHNNVISNVGYEPDVSKMAELIPAFNAVAADFGREQDTFPAMLFDGIGQTLTETGIGGPLGGMKLPPYDVAYTEADYVCAYDNGDGQHMGSPFNPFMMPAWDDATSMPAARPVFEAAEFKCGQARIPLAKTVVTIGGTEYGCGKDDTTSPACRPE